MTSETTGVTRGRNVPLDEFIKVWQTSESAVEVAKILGMKTEGCASARASKYRTRAKNPLPLKIMPRGSGGVRTNPEDAYALLAELGGVDIEAIRAESATMATKNVNRQAEKANS